MRKNRVALQPREVGAGAAASKLSGAGNRQAARVNGVSLRRERMPLKRSRSWWVVKATLITIMARTIR